MQGPLRRAGRPFCTTLLQLPRRVEVGPSGRTKNRQTVIGELMKAFIRSRPVPIVLSASSVYAIPITTVGGIDTIIAQANLSNSNGSATGTEASWIASVLGVNVNTIGYHQLSSSGGSAWQQVTGGAAGLWAFNFAAAGITNPAVFLVKFGNAHVLARPLPEQSLFPYKQWRDQPRSHQSAPREGHHHVGEPRRIPPGPSRRRPRRARCCCSVAACSELPA